MSGRYEVKQLNESALKKKLVWFRLDKHPRHCQRGLDCCRQVAAAPARHSIDTVNHSPAPGRARHSISIFARVEIRCDIVHVAEDYLIEMFLGLVDFPWQHINNLLGWK